LAQVSHLDVTDRVLRRYLDGFVDVLFCAGELLRVEVGDRAESVSIGEAGWAWMMAVAIWFSASQSFLRIETAASARCASIRSA